ncbi:MAG: hypothetical protein ACYTFY_05140 [Planctomycetota bacterium]|jgi:hypothetical protein
MVSLLNKDNYEKMIFFFFLIIASWQVYSLVAEKEFNSGIGMAVLPEKTEAVNVDTAFNVNDFGTYVATGSDFLAPGDMLTVSYEFKKSRTTNVTTRKPVNNIQKTNKVFLPKKPQQKKTTKAVAQKKEKYQLPVEVKGFIVTPGQPRKVLVTKRGTTEYFTLSEGEFFGGITVVKITSESVIFENQLGRQFKIHRDSLLLSAQEENAAGALQDAGEMVKKVLSGKTGKLPVSGLPVSEDAAKKILSGIKGGNKGIDLNKAMKVYEMMKKGNTEKALSSLSDQEKKALMNMAKDFMGGK